MRDKSAAGNKTKASRIMTAASADLALKLPVAQSAILEDALKQDLDTAAEQLVQSEERLAKVEAQVRVLSDAVIVIAEPSEAVDAAVQAVKDQT
jgi:hypothetical protein